MKKTLASVFIFSLITFFAGSAHAVKPPLFTDEATTIGKGKVEIELNGEYAHNSDEGVTEKETVIEPKFTYGVAENIDIALAAPYKFIRVRGGADDFSSDGFGDAAISLKWRLYEEHGLAFAVRPGITLPTGSHEDELGTGKVTYSLFLLGTKEFHHGAFHANIGYLRNENKSDARKDILFGSAAVEYEAVEHLALVADIGIHTNADKNSNTHPAYILGGLIYSVSKNMDVDLGLRGGLTKTEPDYTLLWGMKLKF